MYKTSQFTSKITKKQHYKQNRKVPQPTFQTSVHSLLSQECNSFNSEDLLQCSKNVRCIVDVMNTLYVWRYGTRVKESEFSKLCRTAITCASAYASTSTSAWKYQNVCHRGTKKNCRGTNNFFSSERQVPIPRHTLQMQFETDAIQHSCKQDLSLSLSLSLFPSLPKEINASHRSINNLFLASTQALLHNPQRKHKNNQNLHVSGSGQLVSFN